MILRDRDANTAWESQADQTPEERVYYCQSWRADVVALMTSAGALINQVRYDPYGVPFGIAKTDLDADGDVDNADATLFATYHAASTMPFADWNWDGTKDLSDQSAYTADKNADSGLGRGVPAYATWSHAGAANRKLYAGYEMDPVLTGSEGWQSVYHVRNRVYLSQLGRWTRRDPLGQSAGINVYLYAWSIPSIVVDSLGLLGTGAAASGAYNPECSSDLCIGGVVIAGLGRAPSLASSLQHSVFDGYQFLAHLARLFPSAPSPDDNSRGIPDFLWHGNWCGPGYGGDLCNKCPGEDGKPRKFRICYFQDCGPDDSGRNPDGSCPTKSESDKCCKTHDECFYRSCTDYKPTDKTSCQQCCDQNMCRCLQAVQDMGPCEWFKNLCMQAAFCNFNDGNPGGDCSKQCKHWDDDCTMDPNCNNGGVGGGRKVA